jgi:uncharacterized protein
MSAVAPELQHKQEKLFDILRSMDSVMVAYSGGTDSAYLAWAAGKVLGDRALAITADSASIPESHKHDAEEFTRRFNLRHQYIDTNEFENPDYVRNDSNRCFHCKDELFTRLAEFGRKLNVGHIVYGVNVDDTKDFRPGHKAAKEHGVRAPLLEADLTKAEIRELSRQEGLPTWDRPAAACLSSRIPYGSEVTREKVKTIESGEEQLHSLGFRVYRVRHHGDLVRIEIGRDELPRALNPEIAEKMTVIFKALGFKYVTLDLQGYRLGSLNESLGASPGAGNAKQILPILS